VIPIFSRFWAKFTEKSGVVGLALVLDVLKSRNMSSYQIAEILENAHTRQEWIII
jgi:hypothetical protein